MPGSNQGRRSETAICIYGLKERIRARKSPETVDAPGFAPDASIPVTLYGPSGETRTPGILLPKQARYQLRYTRLWNCFICGLSCGLGRFLTTGFAKLVPTSGSVPAGCEVGSFPSWMGGICSQTYREHFFSSFLAVFSAF